VRARPLDHLAQYRFIAVMVTQDDRDRRESGALDDMLEKVRDLLRQTRVNATVDSLTSILGGR